MRLQIACIILLAIFPGCFLDSAAQEYFGTEHLKFVKSIPLEKVTGRVHNMDFNLKDSVVYIAAEENNSLEVVDLKNGKLVCSIRGIKKPKSVCYIAQNDEIFVTTGTNNCYFFDSKSFEKVAVLHLMSHSDPALYDSAKRTIYVGYGEEGIASINADTHKKTGFFPLYFRPAAFKIDNGRNRLYINLPNNYTTTTFDLKEWRLGRTYRTERLLVDKFDVDTIQDRLFIGYEKSPVILLIDGKTGRELKLITTILNIENIHYDTNYRKLYVSGDGRLNIFQESAGSFKQIANIKTSAEARNSFFIPHLNLYIIAIKAKVARNAELLVYKIV